MFCYAKFNVDQTHLKISSANEGHSQIFPIIELYAYFYSQLIQFLSFSIENEEIYEKLAGVPAHV